ncbi:glycosyltransferase family 4 protein [Acinetobacter guillouiae]|uniref:glycosyltransferase family 4 protein n=1 Tax=Acinetobacter guillouiae TaxID=106649 RepID=UPI001FD936E8|nr:glycosyltransferase family 4 protein [Acinetobacter guillouiae]MBP2546892.1 glycosyltransferase involved in cell wall biosynthesis [Acinetobacter guillouiae]
MKKILFYFTSMTPAGGIERVISTLANHFSEFMEVTILVKDHAYSHYSLSSNIKLISLNSDLNFDMNSKIKRIGQASINLVQSTVKLKKYLALNQYDLYYLAHPLNVLEFHLAHGINENVIITEHGGINAYNLVYKQIKRWLYVKARSYVVPTSSDAKAYTNLNFPVEYIPHFKSTLNYECSDLSQKVVLSIGRMTEAKRQWIMIDLWNKIVNEDNIREWELHLVGSGNLKDQLNNKIITFGLQEYVKILPPVQNVDIYYKNSSIFMLTSHSEGFGMVLLEAISFGLPCISYDCPSGPRDIVENEVNGYLIPMDDFEGLRNATLNLLTNSEKLHKLADGAYNTSLKWNDEAVLKKWKKILS